MKAKKEFFSTLEVLQIFRQVISNHTCEQSAQLYYENYTHVPLVLSEHLLYSLVFFGQLCAGLKRMHNFVPPYAHNDVKPGNVLITHRTGQAPLAILMDFGSARPARRQIQSRAEALQLEVLLSFNHF